MRATPRSGERVDDCLADGNIPEVCGATTEQLASSNPNDAEKLPDGATPLTCSPMSVLQG